MSDLVLIESGAQFSSCRRWRYSLTRRFAEGPTVLFVGLNPSTADEHADDPTIRRCLGFARSWGYGQLVMANLYAWRATDPRELVAAHVLGSKVIGEPDRIGGNHNDTWLYLLAGEADLVVVAWGADPGPEPARPGAVLDLIGDHFALGLTKHGQPRHPLYMRADAHLIPYTPPERS